MVGTQIASDAWGVGVPIPLIYPVCTIAIVASVPITLLSLRDCVPAALSGGERKLVRMRWARVSLGIGIMAFLLGIMSSVGEVWFCLLESSFWASPDLLEAPRQVGLVVAARPALVGSVLLTIAYVQFGIFDAVSERIVSAAKKDDDEAG